MRLRILTDLFRQKCVCKTLGNTAQLRLRPSAEAFTLEIRYFFLKYTKYSCGFTPFSDEKFLVRLSCRFAWYCLDFFPRKNRRFRGPEQKFCSGSPEFSEIPWQTAKLWYNEFRQLRLTKWIWGYSSAGRALEWHSRGQRFDPAYLHHVKDLKS